MAIILEMDGRVDEKRKTRDRWLLISILCATLVLFLIQGLYFLDLKPPYAGERQTYGLAGMFSLVLSFLSAAIVLGALKDSKWGYALGEILGFLIVFDSLVGFNLSLDSPNVGTLFAFFGLVLGFMIASYSNRLRKSAKARESIKDGTIMRREAKTSLEKKSASNWRIYLVIILIIVVVAITLLVTMGWSGPAESNEPRCGDGICNVVSEDCETCEFDCGSCESLEPGYCGDGVCDTWDLKTGELCLEDCGNMTKEEYYNMAYDYVKGRVLNELAINCVGSEEDCQRLRQQQFAQIPSVPLCVNKCGDGICNYQPCDLVSCPCMEYYGNCQEDCGSNWGDYPFEPYPLSYRSCERDSDCVGVPIPGCYSRFEAINKNNTEIIDYVDQNHTYRIAFDNSGGIQRIICDINTTDNVTNSHPGYCAPEFHSSKTGTHYNICFINEGVTLPSVLPDLVLIDAYIEPENPSPDEPIKVHVIIKNEGDADVNEQFDISLADSRGLMTPLEWLPSLKSGEEEHHISEFPVANHLNTAGGFLEVWVDHYSHIIESNEDNNMISFNYSV